MNKSIEKGISPIEDLPSLQDLAYQAIKASILTLALTPGEQISVSELSEQLKVSKSPVREALQRLEREKLVRIVPRTGVFVTEITTREIEEITEIRSVLIGLAACRAVENVTEEEIDRATRILEAGDRALNRNDLEDWLSLNDQFHDWLLQVADNLSLRHMLSEIDDYFQRIQILASHRPGEVIESNTEHYAILDAINARNSEKASKAAINHITNIGKQAVKCSSNIEE